MSLRGRRLVARVLGLQSGRVVAARCGGSPAAVSRWASGESVPSLRAQAVLWAVYGIAVEVWVVPTSRRR